MELYAKKSLGQHFLNSKHVLAQIIEAAGITKGETVLEIGPGTGILTEALLETGANVVAIEKDSRAIELLRTKFEVATQNGRLKVIEGDVLEESFNNQFPISKVQSPASNYSLIANIPYYITGAILEKFLDYEPRPNRMVLLVQKEVAERICIENGKESILSVSVKAFGTPKIVAKVPRGAFTPAPTVDSAILSITGISDERFVKGGVAIRAFFDILRAGFAHKRKYLIRNLEELSESKSGKPIDVAKIQTAWQELGLDLKIRAEDMAIGQWFDLASKLA